MHECNVSLFVTPSQPTTTTFTRHASRSRTSARTLQEPSFRLYRAAKLSLARDRSAGPCRLDSLQAHRIVLHLTLAWYLTHTDYCCHYSGAFGQTLWKRILKTSRSDDDLSSIYYEDDLIWLEPAGFCPYTTVLYTCQHIGPSAQRAALTA